MLPEHVWGKYTGNDGKNLKTYDPSQHLPTVSGGPYVITSFQEKGTTAFKPNPNFYGPKSNAAGVAMTYYTNSTSMIADLQSGNIDFVDQMPFDAVASVKKNPKFNIQVSPSSTVNNITFNSNPAKPKNRELLNPKVKEALEYATDRQAIVKVVYFGYAKPWANFLSLESPALPATRRSSRFPTTRPRRTRCWTRWASRWAPTTSGSRRRRPASTPSRLTRCHTI